MRYVYNKCLYVDRSFIIIRKTNPISIMGIQGLHNFLSEQTRPERLDTRWRDRRVGVDAMCWMHRGAFSCALEL